MEAWQESNLVLLLELRQADTALLVFFVPAARSRFAKFDLAQRLDLLGVQTMLLRPPAGSPGMRGLHKLLVASVVISPLWVVMRLLVLVNVGALELIIEWLVVVVLRGKVMLIVR